MTERVRRILGRGGGGESGSTIPLDLDASQTKAGVGRQAVCPAIEKPKKLSHWSLNATPMGLGADNIYGRQALRWTQEKHLTRHQPTP
jgi:hypothetical protein